MGGAFFFLIFRQFYQKLTIWLLHTKLSSSDTIFGSLKFEIPLLSVGWLRFMAGNILFFLNKSFLIKNSIVYIKNTEKQQKIDGAQINVWETTWGERHVAGVL